MCATLACRTRSSSSRTICTRSPPRTASSSRSTLRSSSSDHRSRKSCGSDRSNDLGGVHDMGGSPAGPVDRGQHEVEDWERLADAINGTLGVKGLQTTDELRRSIESLERYRDLSYYERWVAATEKLLVEKGVLSSEEIDERVVEIERRWNGP